MKGREINRERESNETERKGGMRLKEREGEREGYADSEKDREG